MTLITEKEAQDTSSRSMATLEKQGWCLWRCEKLNDIIVVIRDDFTPNELQERAIMTALGNACGGSELHGGAYYTRTELRRLLNVDDSMLPIINEAKIQGGEISSVVNVQKELMEA